MKGDKEGQKLLLWFGDVVDEDVPHLQNGIDDVDGGVERFIWLLEKSNQPPLPITPRKAARKLGLFGGDVFDEKNYVETLHEIAIRATNKMLVGSMGRDVSIIQIIDSLDELNHISNLLEERVEGWKRVASLGASTKGMDVVDGVRNELNEVRDKLLKVLATEITEVAPNLTTIAGHTIAARLIREAGGLKQLAMLPASTIQVLGSRKALFKHLRGGATSPKHGVIYNHPALGRGSKRGKRARTLAGFLARAARVDYFRGALEPSLVEDLHRRMKDM